MFSAGINKISSSDNRVLFLHAIIIFIGFTGIFFYAFQASGFTQFLSVIGVLLMVAGSSFISGSLLGFLFGIPRTLQQDRTIPANDGKSSENKGIAHQVNTNLEEISDWLTKILVGVGLTQLLKLPEILKVYAAPISAGLGNIPNSKIFSVTIIVYYVIYGFLASYIWMRLSLAGAFRRADQYLIDKVEDIKKQTESDGNVLRIVQRQINPSSGAPPIPQDDIDKAIKDASSNAKSEIFYIARSVISENWKDKAAKPKIEQTIPIFRALIKSDSEEEFHRNHAQLGYALKDQPNPDWKEAEAELTKAIEIRDKLGDKGYHIYEFNRAFCNIQRFNEGETSDEIKKKILNDISVASMEPEIDKKINGENIFSEWLEKNK